jgi:Protein of unknown function (DUF2950)
MSMITLENPSWIRRRLRAGAASLGLCLGAGLAMVLPVSVAAQAATAKPAPPVVKQRAFATPEEAAWALILAAEQYDVPELTEILGPEGVDLVVTEDQVQDRNTMADFAAQARQKTRVARDPAKKQAILIIGPEDWPVPIPIVEKTGKWRFDTKAGRQEILYRRIGRNELDAIEVCHGYVEAQQEYASQKHNGAIVNQYAQRIISTPGKQDGLAWQAPDGTWQGPVGEVIARFISEGYTKRYEPFHGYYFKVLKSQGSAAPLGKMNFVVGGAMIGGFALVAAPADYAVSGVKTFIVSHDGVVYEKDLGPQTVDRFRAMERYNPDSTWKPVEQH